MKLIVNLWKQLHAFAGFKLYLNLFTMLLSSLANGIGLLLLIPMLHFVGVSSIQFGNIPLVSSLFESLSAFTIDINLPIVLAIYLLLTIGQTLLQRNQVLLDTRIQQGFSRHLKVKAYGALLQANWEFFLKKRKSDFNQLLTTEIGRVAQGVSLILGFVSALIFCTIQIGIAFWSSAALTSFVLISGLILAYFSRKGVSKAKRLGKQTTELSLDYFSGLSDQLNGIKDIKSNRLEVSHLNWFQSVSVQIERNVTRFVQLQMNTKFFYNVVSALLMVAFIFIARVLYQVEIEQLILIVLIFIRLWPFVISIQNNIQQLGSVLPAFKSLDDLLNECKLHNERFPAETESPVRPLPVAQGIECSGICFRYDPDSPVYALNDISLRIAANQMTAVVGKSGAGKSTLIDILTGLLRPERGRLLVDGAAITDETIPSYRQSIGYVSQDPFLFNTSIRENLLMVKPDATETEIWEALRFAASDEFVRNLPNGVDTVIGDRGTRLSGGERQRIVLARAILKKPEILILDEATSALDHENEAKIQAALERLKGSMTIIVIAHRLSTIRNSDQVVVLENGRIVEQGGYVQLSNDKKGTFRTLLEYQMGS